jgi:hypothetical protein
VCDVVPGTIHVALVLRLDTVGIRREISHHLVTRTTSPFLIRVVPEYRVLDLALQATILFFERLVHRPITVPESSMLHNGRDPPEQPLEPAVQGVRTLT